MSKQKVSFSLIRSKFRKSASAKKAKLLGSFFKTGKGQYGEGDRFLGIMVPQTRALVKQASMLKSQDLLKFLYSPFHEERLLALLVMVAWYEKGDPEEKARVFNLYLKHRKKINNWDLVDLTAPRIVGPALWELGPETSLEFWPELLQSPSLWDRRIAVLSTAYFIRQKEYQPTLEMAELLLSDPEDLMHKAVGWMLREVGKRDKATLEGFLKRFSTQMPRTMLRYSIEKFTPKEREYYLNRT